MPREHNIYDDIMLHTARETAKKAQLELKDLKKEHDEIKKKKDLDDKLHQETKKELHKYKMQYDPNYVVDVKNTRKEVMQRARLAKKAVKKPSARKTSK